MRWNTTKLMNLLFCNWTPSNRHNGQFQLLWKQRGNKTTGNRSFLSRLSQNKQCIVQLNSRCWKLCMGWRQLQPFCLCFWMIHVDCWWSSAGSRTTDKIWLTLPRKLCVRNQKWCLTRRLAPMIWYFRKTRLLFDLLDNLLFHIHACWRFDSSFVTSQNFMLKNPSTPRPITKNYDFSQTLQALELFEKCEASRS